MGDYSLLPSLFNLVLCAGVGFIAFCRLNAMQGTVLQRVQSEYVGYLCAAAASAMRPFWGEHPAWGSLILPAALLFGLLCSSHAWQNGPPPTTKKGDLDEA